MPSAWPPFPPIVGTAVGDVSVLDPIKLLHLLLSHRDGLLDADQKAASIFSNAAWKSIVLEPLSTDFVSVEVTGVDRLVATG